MTDKMIEEMAKVMCGNDCEECAKETAQWRGCSLKKAKAEECLIKKEAKLLYNAGYRKIPEGSVVLSKEEYELLKSLEESYEHLEKTKDDLLSERSRLALQFARARKETAKEILQSLLDFVNCEKINQGHSFEKIKETLIKVAKTYEVEVEE